MNFGLFMMPLHPPHRSYADSYDRDLDLIVKADQLGFTEAWIGEHITERWENAPAPELLIAKASALTKNIIFGTGVTLLPGDIHSIHIDGEEPALFLHMYGLGLEQLTARVSFDREAGTCKVYPSNPDIRDAARA